MRLLDERWDEFKAPGKKQEPIARSEQWYAESAKKRAAFTALLREQLPSLLANHSYTLTYDNKEKDQQDSHNWVFRIEFTGNGILAIFNDDYRDYTEYFRVTLNDNEAFTFITDDYENAEVGFESFKQKVLDLVSHKP
jgi:hypothetical protein